LKASFTLPSKKNNIIWDLDGVLVTHSTAKTVWTIGPTNFLGGFNPSGARLEECVFQLLNEIQPIDQARPVLFSNYGNQIPGLMIDYLMGNLSGLEVKALVKDKVSYLTTRYDSKRKLALVHAIINFIFTPLDFISVITPVPDAIKLFHQCQQAKNADGSNKNRLFIITNWDSASFRLLAQDPVFSSFLDLCDDIVVSGFVHMIKPDPTIFTYAFRQFAIDPSNELTLYIDDRPENLTGAQSLGHTRLRTIHCKNFDIKSLKKKLKQFDVF